MKHTKWIYAVMFAALVCCIVFIGCPTAEEIADDVIHPMDDDGDDGGDTPPDPGDIPAPPPPGAIPPPPVGN